APGAGRAADIRAQSTRTARSHCPLADLRVIWRHSRDGTGLAPVLSTHQSCRFRHHELPTPNRPHHPTATPVGFHPNAPPPGRGPNIERHAHRHRPNATNTGTQSSEAVEECQLTNPEITNNSAKSSGAPNDATSPIPT